MKAKYFKKIRSQVKWYKVSYRDSLFLALIYNRTPKIKSIVDYN